MGDRDIDIDKFQLSNVTLLNKIDKLREHGVAEYVALPQIVAVGDQSSGKSSVLEGFMHLPLPRDSGLCTRFATQITFRRTALESITVSIIPSPKVSASEAEKLKVYRKDSLKSLNGKEFLGILKEVCKLMGIPGPGETLETGQSSFSSNVLKIELCGPKSDNLTIIDIPGIFRTETNGVTTKQDIQTVRDIVTNYIKDERTIILAVIPAPVDIATQEILTMAQEYDPKGIRTLGVLTKPDLVDPGTEQNVIDLVEGKKTQLQLGYCVVRNLGQKELDAGAADRHQKEESFFNSGPFASLDKDRVGISSLRQRLGELLVDITRREFPKVKHQIDQRLSSCKDKLQNLGFERATKDQQHIYLQRMAIEFQKLTDSALDSYYGRDDIFNKIPQLRLPTLVIDRNDAYEKDIAQNGHTVSFFEVNHDEEIEKPVDDLGDAFTCLEVGAMKPEERGECTQFFDKSDYPELDNVLPEPWDMPKPLSLNMRAWIENEYRKSRGNGLDGVGHTILPTLWKQQCINWEGITLDYMSDIIFLVHDFIQKLLRHVCPDDQTLTRLQGCLEDVLLEKYEKALDQVNFIIDIERRSRPQTLNHYFSDNLQKLRQKRAQVNMSGKATHVAMNGQLQKMVTVDDAATGAQNIGNLEHAVNDISDVLRSYYKVARKRFVDNICMQGCDFYLLNGDDSPLRTFSPDFISSLNAEKLDEIAGEDIGSKRARKFLKAQIESLEKAKKVLRS